MRPAGVGEVMAAHSTVATSAVRPNEPARQVIATFDNYGTAALRGAGSGALVGALIAWIFGLFNWIEPLISALVLAGYGLVFGAIVGALIGLLFYALQGGRRDFHSVSGLRPKYDDVVADVEVADRAQQLLSGPNSRKELGDGYSGRY